MGDESGVEGDGGIKSPQGDKDEEDYLEQQQMGSTGPSEYTTGSSSMGSPVGKDCWKNFPSYKERRFSLILK